MGFYYSTASQTGSTHLDGLYAVADLGFDLEYVRLPHPSRFVVGVTDTVAGNRALSANIASSCHALYPYLVSFLNKWRCKIPKKRGPVKDPCEKRDLPHM